MNNNIHSISNAIIVSEKFMSLVHSYGQNFTYLPDSHVKEDETTFQASQREPHEESDIYLDELKLQKICGVMEKNASQPFGRSGYFYDISFIFAYRLIETQKVLSKENTENFRWHHICHFNDIPLFPSCLNKTYTTVGKRLYRN